MARSRHLSVAAAVVDGELVPGDVVVEDDRVVAVGVEGRGSGIASPGFVDLQVNGFAGVDFMTTTLEGYGTAGEALLETGVTAYQPTLITAPTALTVEALGRLGAARHSVEGPRVIGAHLEGPFLAPERAGAHPVEHLRTPDLDLLADLLEAGPVTTVTLAPELAGALDAVRLLVSHGVRVSLGHSQADAASAHAAFDAGATAVTHLFNAMGPFRHRDPGLVGAALSRDDVTVGLIVDGVHLADETVQLVWRCAGGRVALVTDTIAAARSTASQGTFAGGPVRVSGDAARRPDGTLVGSLLTMDEAVRRLVALGAPVASAVDAATRVPGRFVGGRDLGALHPGAPADIVVLDGELEVRRVLLGGKEAWSRG